jgi:hypothetical protein
MMMGCFIVGQGWRRPVTGKNATRVIMFSHRIADQPVGKESDVFDCLDAMVIGKKIALNFSKASAGQ